MEIPDTNGSLFAVEGELPSRDVRLLIARTASKHPAATRSYALRIVRRLDGGYSQAQVFDAEWLSDGGNVLCAGSSMAFIDHAMASNNQPSWADPARLVGSLWRNAIAPELSVEEACAAMAMAFETGEIEAHGKAAAGATFLRGAVKAATEAGSGELEDQREFWIDLHHFAFIGLKWEGRPSQWMAMALLAAEAAEQVKRLEEQVRLQAALAKGIRTAGRGLARLPDMFAAVVEETGRLDGLDRRLRAGLHDLLANTKADLLARLEVDAGKQGYLVPRLLERALTGAWSPRDMEDAALVRRSSAGGMYAARDRVVLADIAFFRCITAWDPDSFGLLLDLLQDGEPSVEAEALGLLAWLLTSRSLREHIDGEPALVRRLTRLLDNPSFASAMVRARRDQCEATAFFLDANNSKRAISFDGLSWFAWLRPLDVERDLDDEQRSLAPEGFWELLATSAYLCEPEKTAFAHAHSGLSAAQRHSLNEVLTQERTAWHNMGIDRRATTRWSRTVTLLRFISHTQNEEQRAILQERLLDQRRSFAELVADQGRRSQLAAEDLSLSASVMEKAGETTVSLSLAEQACTQFQHAARLGALATEQLTQWARQLVRRFRLKRPPPTDQIDQFRQTVSLPPSAGEQRDAQALLALGYALGELAAADPEREKALREQAIDRYKAAVAVKPDMHEALFNWGWQLGELARLAAADPEREKELREQAIDRYKTAVAVKPDMHEALFNWGCELARLAAADPEREKALREQAIDRYKAAVAVKPDKHEALFTWGWQLGELARLAAADPEHKEALHRAAIAKCDAVLKLKPMDRRSLERKEYDLLWLAHLLRSRPDERQTVLQEALHTVGLRATALGIDAKQLYNHACVHALLGLRAAALEGLERALEAGEVDTVHVRKDPDWNDFHNDPEFDSMLERFMAKA